MTKTRWDNWTPDQQRVIAAAEIGITGVVQTWVDQNSEIDPKLSTLDAQVKRDVSRFLEDAQDALECPRLEARIKYVRDRINECHHVLVAVELE